MKSIWYWQEDSILRIFWVCVCFNRVHVQSTKPIYGSMWKYRHWADRNIKCGKFNSRNIIHILFIIFLRQVQAHRLFLDNLYCIRHKVWYHKYSKRVLHIYIHMYMTHTTTHTFQCEHNTKWKKEQNIAHAADLIDCNL